MAPGVETLLRTMKNNLPCAGNFRTFRQSSIFGLEDIEIVYAMRFVAQYHQDMAVALSRRLFAVCLRHQEKYHPGNHYLDVTGAQSSITTGLSQSTFDDELQLI